jgi:hypothetical protein
VAGTLRGKLEKRLQLIPPPAAFLLIGRNACAAFHPHIGHIEQRGCQAVGSIKPGVADGTAIVVRVGKSATGQT